MAEAALVNMPQLD
uniref:Zinc finger protein 549 n=1 Tax=Gorilla gorilla gorilla TaxID=9595 RepID=A0A2I2ZT73_GORGO